MTDQATTPEKTPWKREEFLVRGRHTNGGNPHWQVSPLADLSLLYQYPVNRKHKFRAGAVFSCEACGSAHLLASTPGLGAKYRPSTIRFERLWGDEDQRLVMQADDYATEVHLLAERKLAATPGFEDELARLLEPVRKLYCATNWSNKRVVRHLVNQILDKPV